MTFKKGDRVQVKSGDAHPGMEDMVVGVVDFVSDEAPLAVLFDGMSAPHKWYVSSELEPDDSSDEGGDDDNAMSMSRAAPMTKIETRAAMDGVEALEDAQKRTLVGYGAVFNSPADIGGCWIEVISPGAFAGTIGGDIRALINHDSGRVIGRTRSGTLRLSEDTKGLRVEIDLPSTSDGNDLWELVERGDVNGMSFGFCVTKQSWDETVDPPIRTIDAVELREVSAVAFPAYDDTTLGVRSLEEWRSAHKTTKTPPITDPAAAPVSRAAATRARLKMGLELKTRSTR